MFSAREEKLFRLISHEGVVELCVPSVCDLMDGGQKQRAERQLTGFCRANGERDGDDVKVCDG